MLRISKKREQIPVYDFTVEDNHNFYCNSVLVHNCGEILLRPQEFCNLTEVVIREDDTLETLKDKVELATILGTYQSTLTDFRYLRSAWKKNVEEERLLGVSLTGIMDHPILSTVNDTAIEWLIEMRLTAIEANKIWADKLGINPSAAITCCKPSGCTTLETEIKTAQGDIISMEEIFKSQGYNAEFLSSIGSNIWLDIDLAKGVLPKVLDENNSPQEITKLYVNGSCEVFEIEFEDGNSYEFTGNHKLKTISGWKRVDELTDNDEIINF